ncbi:uncharacterized protein N7482_003483 [Penicillium canariense]|uniref:Uncharacterized protein n=1 Tax=Penicillium canariense TaxID=189055 RepID=A0A9W9LNF5_9EURO|nr:uncharacterized protein N7482_003483 [Penicillium canariense]KAJ5167889.1 hypothetical protein N7482_003483 [Penicillium canariense]
MIAMVGIALPNLYLREAQGEHLSMTENITTTFEMLRGDIGMCHMQNPELDAETAEAIDQPNMLNAATFQSDFEDSKAKKAAIELLRSYLTEFDIALTQQPSCLATICTNGIVDRQRTRQPFQPFICMHWDVLLNELGSQFWWAQGSGMMLMAELLDELQCRENTGWRCATQWPQLKTCI